MMYRRDFAVNLTRGVVEDFNSAQYPYEWKKEEVTQIKQTMAVMMTDENLIELTTGFNTIDPEPFTAKFVSQTHKYGTAMGGRVIIQYANGALLVSPNYALYVETDDRGVILKKSKVDFAEEKRSRQLMEQNREQVLRIDFKKSEREVFSDNPNFKERSGKTISEYLFIKHVGELVDRIDSKEKLMYILSELNLNAYKLIKKYDDKVTVSFLRKSIHDSLKTVNFSLNEDITKIVGFEMS
jgi:hypothetical protein